MNTLLILAYISIILAFGIMIGMGMEQKHQRKSRIKFRAQLGSTIEQQMAEDGWKI
jgi:hypothetical protein